MAIHKNSTIKPSVEEQRKRALKIIDLLQKNTLGMQQPMVFSISEKFGHDPFLILISCLLSLRAKDTTTLPICLELFTIARTPQQLLKISKMKLEKLIYPVGFYQKKAAVLHDVADQIITRFDGKVPSTREELLSLPGVGRKTANLVLGEGFGIPAICVDTHVHRISNRLGLIATQKPEETEKELEKVLPKQFWIEWNRLLVMWGQNICVPISPFCSRCALFDVCDRVGVIKSR
ncbi:MAG: endonuclease III [Candidatus Babeliales bacterium]